MGDELTSSVKILFFEVNSTLPLLQVPSNSQVIPLQIPCKSHCGVLNKLTLLKPKKVSL